MLRWGKRGGVDRCGVLLKKSPLQLWCLTCDGPHRRPSCCSPSHLSPVAVPSFPYTVFHFLSCCFNGPPVSAPEGSLLLVEGSLDFPCYPRLVIRVAADHLDRRDHVCAEIQVICQTVCHPLYVLNMWVDQHIPDSGVISVY